METGNYGLGGTLAARLYRLYEPVVEAGVLPLHTTYVPYIHNDEIYPNLKYFNNIKEIA